MLSEGSAKHVSPHTFSSTFPRLLSSRDDSVATLSADSDPGAPGDPLTFAATLRDL